MKVGGGAAGGGVEWRKPGGAGGCSEPGSGAGGELQRRTSSLLAPLLFSTSELRLAARQFPLHKPQSQQQRNASRRGGLHGVKKKEVCERRWQRRSGRRFCKQPGLSEIKSDAINYSALNPPPPSAPGSRPLKGSFLDLRKSLREE